MTTSSALAVRHTYPGVQAARRAAVGLATRPLLVAVLTGITWTAIMAVRMFVPGPIGLADQGDAGRLLCGLGLAKQYPWASDSFFTHATFTWVPHTYYGETCGIVGTGQPYASSQLLLLRLARLLTGPLGLPGALDTRALAVVSAVIIGVAIALFVLVLPGALWLRVLLSSGVGLVVADGGFAGYFASPYAEPAGLLGLLFLCVGLLWLWRSPAITLPRLLLVGAAALFTLTAKTQMVSFLPLIVLGLLIRPAARPFVPAGALRFLATRRGGTGPRAVTTTVRVLCHTLASAGRRLPAVLLSAALVVATVAYLGQTPKRVHEIAVYDNVFGTILVEGHDPEQDLRDLGASPKLASAANSTITSSNTAAVLPEYREFTQKVTQATVLRFYARHPGRLLRLASSGMQGVESYRLPGRYVSSYPAGSGHPKGASECRVCALTWVFKAFANTSLLLIGFWLLVLIAGLVATVHARLTRQERAVGLLAVFLVLSIWAQFWTVLLSDGTADLIKHMAFVDFLTGLCLPVLASCLVSVSRGLRRRTRRAEAVESERLDPVDVELTLVPAGVAAVRAPQTGQRRAPTPDPQPATGDRRRAGDSTGGLLRLRQGPVRVTAGRRLDRNDQDDLDAPDG